ncbi:MAG TPA: c-type cytochrome [Candidatus Eisenbacteria bacterium]|nr:c-type cytochrome [Candidatus Eisenbacteria bacterium]
MRYFLVAIIQCALFLAPPILQSQTTEQQTLAASPSIALQIANGKSTFRVACSYCHGLNADGGFRAPSLISGHLSHGDTDEAILNNILHGIPGTAMPANDIDEAEARDVIAYLHSLQKPASAPASGNLEAGHKVFFGEAYCSRCHMVLGQGGRFGPDLSRVGASRPRDYLIESIRKPDAQLTERLLPLDFGSVPTPYELVSVTTKQGITFSGLILNEDSFSLQFMDDRENIHSWSKSELQSIVHTHRSPMPAYTEQQLSDSQLDDLVAYLASLRGDSK